METEFLKLSEAVVLDVETTGLYPTTDRIISVAALRVDFSSLHKVSPGNLEIKYETYCKILNPKIPIPKESSRVHGIRDRDVVDKQGFSEIAEELRAFIGDHPIIAHNVKFDKSFLNAEFRRAAVRPITKNRQLCTMLAIHERMKVLSGNKKWPRLNESGPYVHIEISQSKIHSAIEDATNVLKLVLGLRATYVDPMTRIVWTRA